MLLYGRRCRSSLPVYNNIARTLTVTIARLVYLHAYSEYCSDDGAGHPNTARV